MNELEVLAYEIIVHQALRLWLHRPRLLSFQLLNLFLQELVSLHLLRIEDMLLSFFDWRHGLLHLDFRLDINQRLLLLGQSLLLCNQVYVDLLEALLVLFVQLLRVGPHCLGNSLL